MQQKMLKLILLQLRIAGGLLTLAAITAILMSFTSRRIFADVWQQLGISKERGAKNIDESFLNGYFHYYGAEKAKNLLTGDRVAIARDLMSYAKQQVDTEAFKKQYEQERKNAKPVEYAQKLKTREEIRQEKIAEA